MLKNLQARLKAVARRQEMMENNMAGLFAADDPAAFFQFFRHEAVADRRHDRFDAPGPQRFHESQVRHDGDDRHIAGQTIFFLETARRAGDHVVAIQNLARLITKNNPIGVAVKGHPGVGFVPEDQRLHFFRVL